MSEFDIESLKYKRKNYTLFLAFEVIFVVGVSNKSYGIKVPHQNILLLLTFTLTYLDLVENLLTRLFERDVSVLQQHAS